MELHQFLTFLFAISLLTMTPGLDTMAVIRNSSRGGFSDGVITSFGICCGLFVHATLSAIGISVILQQSAMLFSGMKMIGAGYLIYLGVMSLKTGFKNPQGLEVIVSGRRGLDWKKSLREGFLSNVLNPKTAIFYLAFLPQFVDPSGSALLQSLFMALCHFVIAMLWQTLIAYMVEKARQLIAKPKVNAWMESMAGGVMLLLGVNLLFSK